MSRKHPELPPYTLSDMLKGKDLDIVAAVLLLSGKLKVDSVELFRNSPVLSVTLLGQYRTLKSRNNNALDEFLRENGDLTMDEVFEAVKNRLKE